MQQNSKYRSKLIALALVATLAAPAAQAAPWWDAGGWWGAVVEWFAEVLSEEGVVGDSWTKEGWTSDPLGNPAPASCQQEGCGEPGPTP